MRYEQEVFAAYSKDTAKQLVTQFSALTAITSFSLEEFLPLSHAIAVHRGWWDNKDGTPKTRNVGEIFALMHSEISEGLEAYRTNSRSTKLPGMSEFVEEMADLFIRMGDLITVLGESSNFCNVVAQKCKYNLQRKDLSREARESENGKLF